MRLLYLLLTIIVVVGCNKSEKQANLKANPPTLETAAEDFKTRVEALKATKLENAVFADVRHDVSRTNSITSPLKAEVQAKQIIKKDDGAFTIYDLQIFAAYRDNQWHYERFSGKLIKGGAETEIRGDSTQLRSAYDFVKALRLRHDDIGFEQF